MTRAAVPRAAPHGVVARRWSAAGRNLRPGELSLANHGVLFLDELPEFRRDALEALRGPMEDGVLVIARAVGSVSYPCRTAVIAAMNPCPCGGGGPGLPCLPSAGTPIAGGSRARCSTAWTSASACSARRRRC